LICRNERLLIIKLGQAVLNAKNDSTARQAAYDDFKNKWNLQEHWDAHNALTTAARSLLERIMDVGEGAAPSDERVKRSVPDKDHEEFNGN
jgi:hypothetical protein